VLIRPGWSSARANHKVKREERMAEPTYEELKARLAELEKQVETKKRSGDLVFKVGEKGGVSVYGLGRFPVTLYYEQWKRLLGAAEEIKKFLEENKSKLKLKEQG
jgi:ribosome-interacting GTPase 1